jgi:shikimate dehydrogenase
VFEATVAAAFEALAPRRPSAAPDARRAIVIGLLGRGIGASLSPAMHEREGERLGLDYRYHLIDFDALHLPDEALPAVLKAASAAGFAGLNITYPFKQAVLAHLDRLAPEAATIGAVNTVVFAEGRATGHNTDCWGFAESFRRGLPAVPREHVLQFGAGGAGAAVAQALLQSGVTKLSLHDTDPHKMSSLVETLRDRFDAEVCPVADPLPLVPLVCGIVNTTPVGMDKYPGTPFDTALLRAGQWVADIIYFPRETELVCKARAAGCHVLTGGGMAAFQAVRAFELFTGIPADHDAMLDHFEEAALHAR